MTAEFIVAVHAIVFLNHKGCCVSSEEIAENICTNPARVRKVLARLKKAGLVGSKGGIEGGYYFTGKAAEVSLNDVFDAVGADIVNVKWRSGSQDIDCLIACGMAGIMDDVFRQLNDSCAETLSKITIAGIDNKLFGANGGKK